MTSTERRILLLDAHTINQIAAGEVVERPASVVKELVENSLDAGATRIDVELQESGRRLIRVSDNGCGMGLADLQSAMQRHATSKIRSIGDLGTTSTLGFRGEALPSIASVSRMSVSSATEDGVRHVLRLEGGQASQPVATGGAQGTEVVVEDLFHNTPARLKFLKTDATELSACVELVQKYAVAYPGVSFSLRHGASALVTSHGDGDLLSAISEVWGRETARALAEIDSFLGAARVRGFISPPHLTKPTRAYQWVFVNGRPVKTRALTTAIEVAYRSLTPERRFPVAVIMLDVDPAKLDVNVSPTKTEVRFQHEGMVFDAVRHAIRSALLERGMVPSAEGIASANAAIESAMPAQAFWTPPVPTQVPLTGIEASANAAGALRPGSAHKLGLGLGSPGAAPLPVEDPAAKPRFADLLDGLRVIGQMMNTFILAENRMGLLIIDQHVAHERVLFEMLCLQRGTGAVERQSLLAPETLHVDRRAASILREKLDDVRAVGFDLEPFGGESFLVRAVPAALKGKDPIGVLRDLADEIAEEAGTTRMTPTREKIWITCSCKMAVKAGDVLSVPEMEKLIQDLAATENPYLCPHGRPITIVMARDDLLRKFKRL